METQTIQETNPHYLSSVPFSFLTLESGLALLDEPPLEKPQTITAPPPSWPPFIAEYDYQMENGSTAASPDPSPSPALSFEQLSPGLDQEMIREKTTPEVFTLFPHLPIELRQHIWRFACQHSRNISIWFNTFVKPTPRLDFHPGNNLLTYQTNTPDPDVLYVCKEAREEALKHYNLYFGTKHTRSWFTFETRPRIWCNLNVDTICLTSNFYPRYTNSHYEDFFKKCAKTNMRSLAYNIYQFFSYRGYTSGVNWSKIFRILDAYGDRVSELREIVLYYDDDEDFTDYNTVRSEFVELDWGAMDPDCHKIRSLQVVQRDLLRKFPEKAEFVEQGWDKQRAIEIWNDIQSKVKFMDVKVDIIY